MKPFWVNVGSGIPREFEKNRCTVAFYLSRIEELTMRGGGQCLIEPDAM
ncbi:hypothetical protein [Bacillus wiedmannii]